MFTPLSLRTFISPTPNHMSLGQQALTNVGSLVAAQHQQTHQPMPPTQQTQTQTRHHQAANGLPPTTNNNHTLHSHANQSQLNAIHLNVGCVPLRQSSINLNGGAMMIPVQKVHKFHLDTPHSNTSPRMVDWKTVNQSLQFSILILSVCQINLLSIYFIECKSNFI